jgi:non-ribosomal peptide synthetase-like protein
VGNGPVLPGKALYRGDQVSPPRTLLDILEATATRYPTAKAIDDGDRLLSYRGLLVEIDGLVARLRARGIGRGDRVGIRVPSGTAELYVAILAVLAAGAAYVPVDADDPDERAETVWSEAGVSAVIGGGGRLADRGGHPGAQAGRPRPGDDAWIIFTSGSTGVPKGVAVTHRSAAAFVDAEARLFLRGRPLSPGDRVLAGLSVAFDASCEEMWLAWRHGACLVPAARTLVKGGAEFGDWMVRRGISVVSTVPTLAALWTREQLRGVRLLILGGEACPAELAARLAATCPEVWNTYGPTEATVVASAARLTVTGPVRIGVPLAGWELAVADPRGRLVGWGDVGELVIAGVGTARYLDRAKDAEKFVSLPALGWSRAYRTGDLVRAEPEGLSYLGRTDSQVKIRGYRVELCEIESVMLRLPGIAQAVVTTHQAQLGSVELAGYYACELGRGVDPRQVHRRLRALLPAHMVPAYLTELASVPTMTSGKADRKALPPPARRVAAGAGDVADAVPANAIESALADVLAEVLDLEGVSVESHFFDDLSANSVLMAHFCGQVRRNGQMPSVSMKDVYLHPTIRALAHALAERGVDPPREAMVPGGEPFMAGQARYVLCGAIQAGVLLALVWLGAFMIDMGARWIGGGGSALGIYLHAVEAVSAGFTALCVLPLVAKWTLIGRWREQRIQIWSLGYCRFWIVKTLVRASPLTMFAGSPLFGWYLRALGAKIGRGSVIFPRGVPVCTDLLTVGAGTVIRKGCSLAGYRAEAGMIHTGRIAIGDDVVLGDSTFVDINTAIGDGGQLGHSSSLHSGQVIPAGQVWRGSPAAAGPGDCRLDGARCGRFRRAAFTTVQLLGLLLGVPVVILVCVSIAPRCRWLAELLNVGSPGTGWSGRFRDQLVGSSVLLWGGGALALLIVVTVPKMLNLVLTSGRVYPLYGFAYGFYRAISRITSTPFFINLYGDSSYIVGYLRALGYKASRAGQTGSNFGAQLGHDTPYLVSIGAGTMVSDGVRFLTADYSNTSFRVSPVSIGSRCFLGNFISVPSDTRLGDNCFVGTKTMIPVDGDVRPDIGLLGSPPFEIPRTRPDQQFDLTRTELRSRLRAKDRYNLSTIGIFLLVQWVRLYVTLMFQCVAVSLYQGLGFCAIALAGVSVGAFSLSSAIFVERCATSFRGLTTRYCSIYDKYFWWHERFWKLSTQPAVLNGTAFKGLMWGLLGVRIGPRVYDDGCSISEKTLVTIGAESTISAGTVLQAHSMEDGIFKSDHIVVGKRCTLGAGAFVHYGVTIGDGARLATDSFLMKGESVPSSSVWLGNPAREDR